MSGKFGDLAHCRPIHRHFHLRAGGHAAQAQLDFAVAAVALDFCRAQGAPQALLMRIAGHFSHQIAHQRAAGHGNQGRRRAAFVSRPVPQHAGQRMPAGERDNPRRPLSADDHHRPERVGVVIMKIDPAAPVMNRIARDNRVAEQICISQRNAIMHIFEFGVHQFPEQTIPVLLRQPHVGFGEGIIFRQIVNQSAFFNGFHQAHAFGHGVKRGHLGQHMLARRQTADSVGRVRRAVSGQQHRVHIVI